MGARPNRAVEVRAPDPATVDFAYSCECAGDIARGGDTAESS
jgi:hypothetical protein